MAWSLPSIAKGIKDIVPTWSVGNIIRYWSFVHNDNLKCKNAYYYPPVREKTYYKKEIKRKRILCKLTKCGCVCATKLHSIQGDVLFDFCVNCPGFKKRRKKL